MKRFESYQSLGDSVEIINGFPAKSSFFNSEGNGLPLIRIRNITKGDSDTYYSGEYQDNYIVDKGDILIGMDGEFNIAKWSGSTSLLNQRVCKIKNTVPPFNIDYVYFQLQVGLKEIEARTPSTTVKHLSIKDIRKLRVYCPPLPVQQKIAEILSTVDEQISATERIIEKSKELKKGLMQKLFSEGIEHTEFKDTKIGRIPKDWEVVKLGDITDIKVGRDLNEERHSDFKTEKYKYPIFSNTVSNYGLYGYYDFAEYEGRSLTIVGRGVGIGTSFPRTGGYGAIGRLLILFPQEDINEVFLSSYVNAKMKIHREDGAIPQLTGAKVSSYKVVKPPLEEQNKIANILFEADQKVVQEEHYKSELEKLKKGLMQQLLTGQKRVKL